MKSITVIAALIMGMCFNSSAQNRVNPTSHLASYKTSTPSVRTPNFENSRPFLGGYQLEIAENKTRKVFAELNDLGEGFYVPVMEKQSKPSFDLAVAKKEIEEANRNFMDLVAKGDSVGLANSYTIDAKFMSAGAPAVVGRANIQGAMSGIVKSGITKVDIRLKEVFGTEDLIAEEGELTLYVKGKAVAEEKYIVLWKKEDGRWKLFRDIFNSNLPVPASK